VKNDPRSHASQPDLDEQFKLQLQIRDAVSAANNAVRTIRNVKAQMAAAMAKMNDAALQQRVSALGASLSRVEAELYSVQNRAGQDMLNYPIKLNDELGSLYNSVSSADGKPTAQEYEVFKLLSGQLTTQIAALNDALGPELTAVNRELARLKQPAIVPSTAEPVSR
jgi:seryl-tRNA synthetase